MKIPRGFIIIAGIMLAAGIVLYFWRDVLWDLSAATGATPEAGPGWGSDWKD